MENSLINIRKLVALDMLLHGRPFILVESGLGTLLLLGLGFQQIAAGLAGSYASLLIGFYLVLTGVNYLLLLIYAVIIAKQNSARDEAESELQSKSKYNRQQFLLLVPLLVFLVGVKQELDGLREVKHYATDYDKSDTDIFNEALREYLDKRVSKKRGE